MSRTLSVLVWVFSSFFSYATVIEEIQGLESASDFNRLEGAKSKHMIGRDSNKLGISIYTVFKYWCIL